MQISLFKRIYTAILTDRLKLRSPPPSLSAGANVMYILRERRIHIK